MKICEAGRDPCGCNNWTKGIRTINGQYPDDNRDFDLNAGDGIEITPATAGVTIAMKAPISGPMIYRGTVGTGGTVATLPDANVENSGWTYVAVTAGSTPDDTPVSYNVGDMIISNGQEWTVVPAGDDPYVTLDTAQTITGIKTFTEPKATTRAYNTNNESDIVTIGSLKQSTDVVKTKNSQSIEADNSTITLALKRNIDLSTISSSTAIGDLIFTAINGTNTNFMSSRIQLRRYANRSRIWFSLYRLTNSDETALMFEQYDSGRVAFLISNVVNGVATTHTIVDSTP